MTDLLNLGGDERLDFGDLTYALNQVPAGLLGELTGSFLVPTGTSTIISGFAPSGSGQGPVQVGAVGVPNLALLGQRVAGAIAQGVFSAVGPQTINLSVASLPANTYGVYVRFNRLPGAAQTRKFWSKASPGSEYAQLADTRLVAAWEARLETTQPSAEWLLVGQAVVTAAGSGQGNTVVVTDQRPLFFEGTPGGGYAPVWGSAADRATDRRSSTIFSLQQELDALRQCIVDIKGRGLATWFQPNISGMQVGTSWGLTSTPTANTITLGDAGFYLAWTAGNPVNVPVLAFDGSNDFFQHDRYNGILSRYRGNSQLLQLGRTGGMVIGPNVATPAYVAICPTGQVQGNSLAVQTQQAQMPASVGLLSTVTTRAYLEMGPQVGSGYGVLSTDWSNGPTVNLGAASRSILSSSVVPSSNTFSGTFQNTVLSGDQIAIGSGLTSLSLAGHAVATGGAIWATGYYSFGQNAVFTSCAANMTSAVTRNSNNTVTITFSANLPTAKVVLVTPVFGQGGTGNFNNRSLAPQYQISGNALSVALYNDNAESVGTDFSFVVFYGS